MHTSDTTLSHKILLTWLSWKKMSKKSYLDLSSKSHKSCAKSLSLWELGPGSSWLTHFHEFHSCVCVCVCVCVCFGMYMLTWGTNNYLRIFVLYSFYARPTNVKGKDKIQQTWREILWPGNQHFGPCLILAREPAFHTYFKKKIYIAGACY